MIQKPMDVLHAYPVRKSGKQKTAFREAILAYVTELGYKSTVEKGSFGAKNVIIGDPSRARYLVTAHYDTPARMIVPNLITPCNLAMFLLYQLVVVGIILIPSAVVAAIVGATTKSPDLGGSVGLLVYWILLILMMGGPANKNNANDNTSGVVSVLEIAKSLPEEYREQVCFVLFDLEELGLLGSAGYASKHKNEIKNQIVLNLDCVGDGDHLMMFPTGKLKKNAQMMEQIRGIVTTEGNKSFAVREKGFAYYPSDQGNFPYGVGISALRRTKGGILYCDKIHTNKDTVLEEENVHFLRDRLIELISRNAVN